MTKYRIFDDEFERIANINAAGMTESDEHDLLKEFVCDILKGSGMAKQEIIRFWEIEENQTKRRI